jgi:hypothetical protein
MKGTRVIVNGETFPSVRAAAIRYGLNPNTLQVRIRRNGMTVAEAVAAGPGDARALRTHCARGHPLADDNVLFRVQRGNVVRRCRTCDREDARAYRRVAASGTALPPARRRVLEQLVDGPLDRFGRQRHRIRRQTLLTLEQAGLATFDPHAKPEPCWTITAAGRAAVDRTRAGASPA